MITWTLVISIVLLAIVIGAVVGLLPGFPANMGLLVFLPVFAQWPPEIILLFFVCFICVTQYFGSVSALLFRIPGESSSLPALEIGRKLKQFTSVIKAYRITAFTSLVAGLVGVVLFALLFWLFRENWAYIFSVKFTVSFLIVLLVLLASQNGQWLFNITMMSLGLGLAYSNELNALHGICDSVDSLCFLRTPAENTLILLSLYCLPVLFYRTDSMIPNISTAVSSYLPGWRNAFPFWRKGVWHGILGFVMGFTPGAGVTMASNMSNSIEYKKNPRRLLSAVGAAEAANNSAAVSCTIPFLFLGLPITASELVLDNFLTSKFYRVDLSTLDSSILVGGTSLNFIGLMIVGMLFCNIASFLLCGHFVRLWQKIMSIDIRYYMALVKALVVGSVFLIVYSNDLQWSNAVFTIVLFGGIGTWAMLKNRNIIGLAVLLMIGQFVVEKFSMAYYMYF